MTYRPSIAERITWSSGQLSSAEVKVLAALASCGDWMTGQTCRPYVKTIVTRSGLSRATVTRTLKHLRDERWILPTARRHRHATTYDIQIDRLATSPPKEQQMSISSVLASPESEAHNEPQPELEAQNEPQHPLFEAQNEPPISLKDLDLSTYTHTPRAREDAPDRTLPIVGPVPPPRCAHPHAHAWCEGRVHVPKDLHFEFLDKLGTEPGETRTQKIGRLVAFYVVTMANTPASETIGDSYRFWKRHYATWVAPVERPDSLLTARDLKEAEEYRRRLYRATGRACPHATKCPDWEACVREIALTRKVG